MQREPAQSKSRRGKVNFKPAGKVEFSAGIGHAQAEKTERRPVGFVESPLKAKNHILL